MNRYMIARYDYRYRVWDRLLHQWESRAFRSLHAAEFERRYVEYQAQLAGKTVILDALDNAIDAADYNRLAER